MSSKASIPVLGSLLTVSVAAGWGCSTAPKSSSSDNNAGKSSIASSSNSQAEGSSPASGGSPSAASPSGGADGAANEASPEAQSASPSAGDSGSTTGNGTTTTVSNESGSTATGTSTGSTGGSTSTAAAGPVTPNSWCAAAAKTSVVKNAAHTQGFAALCNSNGTATALFTTLMNNPYEGSGTPPVTNISPLADSNGVASAFFGVALKLPISSATEFNTVALNQGSTTNEDNLMKAQGQTPKSCTINAESANPDTGWVRGWTVNDDSTQTVAGFVTVETTYSYQADQYNLGNGAYMYVNTFISGTNTMKNYQLISAGFDYNGTGYLVNTGNIGASDAGFPSLAESTLTSTINDTITFMYSGAAAAK